MSGLNKEQRLQQEQDEAARKHREATRSLDPPFPFVALAFEPVFFDLQPVTKEPPFAGTARLL